MASPGIDMRPATADDYPAAAELYRQVARGRELSRAQFTAWLDTTTVAVTHGDVVGLCHGNHTSATWQSFVVEPEPPLEWRCSYLDTLVVARSHRGHGVGAALLEQFLDAARAAGNTWVVLRPVPADPREGFDELLAFYGAFGFVPLRHRLTHGLTNALVLGRALVARPDHVVRPLEVDATVPGAR